MIDQDNRIKVSSHRRFDPRLNKKVDVSSYDRKIQIKEYKNLSRKGEMLCSKKQSIIREIEYLLENERIQDIENLITSENFLGSGEFSNAYLISDNLVLKVNRKESKYNPQFWKEIDFTKISKKEMKSEIETYNKLSANYSDILPNLMKGYEIKGWYFVLRDYGQIHIDPEQYIKKRKELIEQYPKVNPKEFDNINIFLPKWTKGKISRKEYDKFTNRIYDLGKDLGYFDDQIQIAQKSDNSLFLVDLGHFRKKAESNTFKIPNRSKKSELIEVYKVIEQRLKHLDIQVGMVHNYPKGVIDFQIDHYESEIKERKDMNMAFLSDFYKKPLKTWEKRRKAYLQKKRV